MALPRAVRIAWLSTSAGAPPLSRMRREVVTSAGPRSTPLRTSSTSSSTSRPAARTCSAGPSSLTRLPRTSTSTSGYWCSSVVSRRSWGPSSRTMATPSTSSSTWSWSARACPEENCRSPCSSPSGKGSFRKSSGEHVVVHVEDGLSGVLAGVEYEPVVAVCVLAGELLRDRHDIRQQAGVGGGERGDIRVLRRLRHDEQVHGRLRRDVAERDHALILVDDVGGDLARDDPLEDRGGIRHASQSTGPPAPVRGRKLLPTRRLERTFGPLSWGGGSGSPAAEPCAQHGERGGTRGGGAQHLGAEAGEHGAGVGEALELARGDAALGADDEGDA